VSEGVCDVARGVVGDAGEELVRGRWGGGHTVRVATRACSVIRTWAGQNATAALTESMSVRRKSRRWKSPFRGGVLTHGKITQPRPSGRVVRNLQSVHLSLAIPGGMHRGRSAPFTEGRAFAHPRHVRNGIRSAGAGRRF
jgi:hypothetical protein